MGSRIMHLCISHQINQQLKLPKKDFLLGSIIPDMHSYMNVSKEQTHFTKFVNGEYRFDYEEFYQMYFHRMHEPLYIGYYCHLFVDNIWLDTVHAKYFAPRSKEERHQFYADFSRMNRTLIKKYNLSMIHTNSSEIHCDIKQIDLNKLNLLLTELGQDFDNQPSETKIIDLKDVIKYIDLSTTYAIHHLKKFNKNIKDNLLI